MSVSYARRDRAIAVTLPAGLALALALVPVSTAKADPPPEPPSPSIAQYVEAVPTSSGDVAAGGHGARKLPSKLNTQIDQQGGQDAAALKSVASSAAYGAPQRQLRHSRPKAPATTFHAPNAVSSAGVSAAAATVFATGSNTLTSLLVVICAVTLVGGAVALRRRRG